MSSVLSVQAAHADVVVVAPGTAQLLCSCPPLCAHGLAAKYRMLFSIGRVGRSSRRTLTTITSRCCLILPWRWVNSATMRQRSGKWSILRCGMQGRRGCVAAAVQATAAVRRCACA